MRVGLKETVSVGLVFTPSCLLSRLLTANSVPLVHTHTHTHRHDTSHIKVKQRSGAKM